MNEPFTVRKELRSSVRCSFCYFADGVLGEGTIWDLSVAGWRSTGNVVVAPGLEVTAYLRLRDDTGVAASTGEWSGHPLGPGSDHGMGNYQHRRGLKGTAGRVFGTRCA